MSDVVQGEGLVGLTEIESAALLSLRSSGMSPARMCSETGASCLAVEGRFTKTWSP